MGFTVTYSAGGMLDRIRKLDLVDRLGTVDTVKLLEQVKNVDLVQKVDLVNRVTSVDAVKRVDAVTAVDKVTQVTGVDIVAVVDRINHLPAVDIGSMPAVVVSSMPGVSSRRNPYGKGFRMDVPATAAEFTAEYILPADMDLASVSVACSGYADGDYWQLERGTAVLFESMYTREVPEAHAMGVGAGALALPIGTRLTMRFNNGSGTSKLVWFVLRFLTD